VPLRDGGGALYHLHQTEESEVKTPEQWAEEIFQKQDDEVRNALRKSAAALTGENWVGSREARAQLACVISKAIMDDRASRTVVEDKAIDPKWHAAALLGFAYERWVRDVERKPGGTTLAKYVQPPYLDSDSAERKSFGEHVYDKLTGLRALLLAGKASQPEPKNAKEMAQLIGQRGDLENKTRKLIRDVLREFGWGKKS
jgi:hypothetical protein